MGKGSATPYLWQRPGEPNLSSRLLAFVLILIFSAILGWISFKKTFLPFDGLYGSATIVSTGHSAILLEKAKILNKKSFNGHSIDRFTVHLTDSTDYFFYASEEDLRSDNKIETDMSGLRAGQTIVVTPREKAGNVVTALSIRILPN